MNARVEPLRAGLAILTAVGVVIAMMLVFSGLPALATHVNPTFIEGNQNCNAATGLSEVLRLEDSDLADGTYPFDSGTGSVTIDINAAGTSFDWTSTEPIAAIFVKGGNDGNLYDYRPGGATSDTGLIAPTVGQNENEAEISHITFCIPDATTTTTEATTTTTEATTTTTEATTTTTEATTTTTVAPTTTTVEDTTTTTEDEVLGTVITTSTTAPVVEVTTTVADEVLDTEVVAEELPFTGPETGWLFPAAVLLLISGLLITGLTGNSRED